MKKCEIPGRPGDRNVAPQHSRQRARVDAPSGFTQRAAATICNAHGGALRAAPSQSMLRRKHIEALFPRGPRARSFLLLALVLGSLYAAFNPPFAVNDERDHWLRTVELSKGRLLSRRNEEGAYYRLPREYRELILRYGLVQRDDGARVDAAQLVHDLVTPESPPQWKERPATASAYSPLPYLPPVPGVWLARALSLPPLWQVYLGRWTGSLVMP